MAVVGCRGVGEKGTVEHNRPLWIKTISPVGTVRNIDWSEPYQKMQEAVGIHRNGYMIHECAVWSSLRQLWVFIPRHISHTPYKPGDEINHGSTVVITADASFTKIQVADLQGMEAHPKAGVSDCKFIPDGKDAYVAVLKVVEEGSTFTSFMAVVDLQGNVLMNDVPLPARWKFEGLEIRPLIHSEQ